MSLAIYPRKISLGLANCKYVLQKDVQKIQWVLIVNSVKISDS